MKRRQFLGAVAAPLFLAACQSNRVKQRALSTYIVEVSGSSDASYTGTFNVDGAVHPISGRGKNSWTIQCHELECWFRQGPEAGFLRFEIHDQAGRNGAVATPGAGGECRFIARDGEVEGRTYLRPIS